MSAFVNDEAHVGDGWGQLDAGRADGAVVLREISQGWIGLHDYLAGFDGLGDVLVVRRRNYEEADAEVHAADDRVAQDAQYQLLGDLVGRERHGSVGNPDFAGRTETVIPAVGSEHGAADVVLQIPVDLARGELQVEWKGGIVIANQIPRALSHRGSEGSPAVADLNRVLV